MAAGVDAVAGDPAPQRQGKLMRVTVPRVST